MPLLDDEELDATAPTGVPDDEDGCWDGDRGTLPLPVRAAIGRLLSEYAVDDSMKFDGVPLLDIIGEHREDVERVLADCMLVLVKNDRYHVAWAEPARVADRDSVIRTAKSEGRVSGVMAYAMCACKEAALEAEGRGAKSCTVDADWLESRLAEMGALRGSRDAKAAAATTQGVIDKLCERRLLRKAGDGYEVRPLLSAVVDGRWLDAVAASARAMAAEPAESGTSDDGMTDVDGDGSGADGGTTPEGGDVR